MLAVAVMAVWGTNFVVIAFALEHCAAPVMFENSIDAFEAARRG
ncbi:MAG TPA: hypothetical protein VNM90_27805 [Haliangium sp.]|nr:hypothetical protein [Haliangium sp.]